MLSHGASREALEDSLHALLALLSSPRTRAELAELLAGRLRVPVELRRGGTGWGNRANTPWVHVGGIPIPVAYALHLAGARGVVCLGPPRGAEATYVRVDAWTDAWRDLPPRESETQLARRYLRSFAPATPHDFATWTGMTVTDAREIWGRITPSLVRVAFAGREAWSLRSDLAELQSSTLDQPSVRLLPYFDSYLLGHRDHGNVVGPPHHARVYRGQGWVSPALLVNGTVAGVWDHVVRGRTLKIRIEPFTRPPPQAIPLAREEASSLARFLGCTQAETVVLRP